MSHHADEEFPHPEIFRKMLDTSEFRGAIGAFPQGKLTKADEGSIQFGVGVKGGKVVLDFGTSITWVGMDAQQAADLASVLLSKAREAGRRTGKMIHVRIG